jgi:hypothetical protein
MYNQSPNSIGPDGKPRGLLCKLSLHDSSQITPTATPVGLFEPPLDLCSAVSDIPLPFIRLEIVRCETDSLSPPAYRQEPY